MLRRIVCSMMVFFAATAQAQIRRQPQQISNTDPDYWVGLSLGYMEGITLSDDRTGALWQFGYSSQIRATLEKTISRGATVGIAAGFANVPLNYEGGSFNGCGLCRADADINQYTAFVRIGGGTGFHGLYELEGGVTQFTNFRESESQARLDPVNGTYDGTIGFGGGIAYGFSRTSNVYISEMMDFVFHQQSAGVEQRAPRFFTFRGGLRFGF